MKKINKHLLFGVIVVIFLSIPAIFSLLHSGFFQTDDGEWMIIRFSAFYQALKDGQIPVRFLNRLNFSYGYPVPTFLYPGFMYFGIPFKIMGFGFVGAIKIILGISLVGSGIFTFFWLSKRFKMMASVIGALLYVYLPYHLYDVYTRGSVGEVFALLWVPFIFWMIERKSVFWISVGIFALIFSHNTLAVLFLPVLFFYALLKKDFAKKDVVLSFVFGTLLSSFFVIPALFELSLTIFSQTGVSNPLNYFSPTPIVGYISIFILLSAFILFIFKHRKANENKSSIILFLIVGILSIFFATSFSSVLWTIIPSSFIQFPFRLLSLLIPAIAFLGAFMVDQTKDFKKILVAIVLLVVIGITSDPYLAPKVFFDREEGYYYTNDATTTVQNEYMPKWVKQQPVKAPDRKVEVIKGKADIRNITSNNRKILFSTNSKADSIVQINTIYWPGWQASIDGKNTTINYKNDNGLMNISIPDGEHSVLLSFGESKLNLFSDAISLIAFIGLLFSITVISGRFRR